MSNGTQRIKIEDCFGLRHEIEFGVPKGSICARDARTAISELQSTSDKLLNWFEKNLPKANPEKCHLLLQNLQQKQRLEVSELNPVRWKHCWEFRSIQN